MNPPSSQNLSLGEINSSVHTEHHKNPMRRFLAFVGPAYLVSVGYMDPGNWATGIAGGSQFGYSLLWVLLMSNLIALLLQSLGARLGIVTGLDLAQLSRASYNRFPNFILYLLAEIGIIACDLAEIIGMAIGLLLLFHLPVIYGIFIGFASTFLFLLLMNKGIKRLEIFIILIISIIALCFIINLFIVKPEFMPIVKGFQPSILTGDALYIAIGIIGATVMPHNLYLHSSLVQTRKINNDDKSIKQAIKYNFFDTAIALNLALFVNAAILILAASAFYKNGYFEVTELDQAYVLLESLLGSFAPALFAIALIVAGQSSTITGTIAGQIVMEGYLHLKINVWIRRIVARSLAVIPAIICIIYFGEGYLGKLLILSQVVLSLQLSFAVIPLIRLASNKTLMHRFCISKWLKYLSWALVLLIIGLNINLVYDEVSAWLFAYHSIWLYVTIFPVLLFLLVLLLYITFIPIKVKNSKL